jgi:hypothetical protein
MTARIEPVNNAPRDLHHALADRSTACSTVDQEVQVIDRQRGWHAQQPGNGRDLAVHGSCPDSADDQWQEGQ